MISYGKQMKMIKILLFLCSILIISSCSKDNYEEIFAKDNSTMKVVVLNSKAIKKEKVLFSTICKLNQKLSRLNSQEKDITSGVYNFSIDTDYCKMITFDSVTSYTFSITRIPRNEDFENIVIKRLPNGGFISKLYKYNVTPEEKHNILHGIDVDMTNKIEVTDIDDSEFTSNIFQRALLCYQVETVWTSGTPCKGEEHHLYGDTSCPFINSPYMQAQAPTLSIVYVPIDCGGGASGTYYGPNGQPYPGYPPGVLDTGVITTPVPQISFEEEQFKLFKKGLNQAQQDWLIQQSQQNENIESSIIDYLNNNDFDTTSVNKIIELINFSMINNCSFIIDTSITNQNANIVGNLSTVSSFFASINNKTATNLELINNFDNTKTARFKFELDTWLYLNCNIKQNLPSTGVNYSIENVSSNISGFTVGATWTQNENDFDNSVTNNISSTTFTGGLSFSIFNGIGVFMTHNVLVNVKCNATNGSPISGNFTLTD